MESRIIQDASWNDLHPPLLEMILDRLAIPDNFRFAAVCRSWHAAKHNHQLGHPSCLSNQMPWIVSLEQELFYNLSEHRYYKIPLPEDVQGKYCCGVSHGWLLFVDDASRSGKVTEEKISLCLLLVNPLTGSKIRIPIYRRMLPTFNTCQPNPAIGMLSTVPTNPNYLVLFGQVDYRPMGQFMYSARNKIWTKLNTKQNPLTKPVHFEGSFYWLVQSVGELVLVQALPGTPNVREIKIDMDHHVDGYFLVQSDGQLLLTTFVHYRGCGVRDFQVFKVDVSQRVLLKLESIGDRVLFYNISKFDSAFSLSADDTGGPGNRIYITGWTRFFEASLEYKGQLWIEYDYESHQVVNKKIQHPMNGFLRWIVPSLG